MRHLVELPRQLVPRFADMLRIVAPVSIAGGTTHSLTGATGVVPVAPSTNPAEGKVGEPFVWVFRTTGEKAKSYSFSGLPPGITDSGVVRNAVSSISGSPTTPGTYNVKITGWENSGQRGRKTPTYSLTIQVTGGLPPMIEAHPQGGIFNEGEAVELVVGASGPGVAYQWRKDGVVLSGTAFQNQVLRFESVRPEDAGSYSVEVSNGNGAVVSEVAAVEVRPRGSWDHWSVTHGVADSLADPDGDGLSNLMEYALGTDPNKASVAGIPKVRIEEVQGVRELVAEFTIDPAAVDGLVGVEASPDLSSSNWSLVRDGEGGAQISRTGELLSVRLPVQTGTQFLRLTISLR